MSETVGSILIMVAAVLIAIGLVQGMRHIRDGRPFDFGAPWLIAGLLVGNVGHALLPKGHS